MGRVLNIHRDKIPSDAIYIGRGKRGQDASFGNQFVIGKHGTRQYVIARYEIELKRNEALIARIRSTIKHHDVVCFCAPAVCHGNVLQKVAAMTDEQVNAWRQDPDDLVVPLPPAETQQAGFSF